MATFFFEKFLIMKDYPCRNLLVLSYLIIFCLLSGNSKAGALSINPAIQSVKNCLDTIPPDARRDTIDGQIFYKPTKEATFKKGGEKGWTRYFQKEVVRKAQDANYGMCLIGFVIDEDGNIRDVKAIKMTNPGLAKAAIDVIENSPQWIPAELNGEKISSYREQPFTIERSKGEMQQQKQPQGVVPVPTHKGKHF